jgi:hypothetical protein
MLPPRSACSPRLRLCNAAYSDFGRKGDLYRRRLTSTFVGRELSTAESVRRAGTRAAQFTSLAEGVAEI